MEPMMEGCNDNNHHAKNFQVSWHGLYVMQVSFMEITPTLPELRFRLMICQKIHLISGICLMKISLKSLQPGYSEQCRFYQTNLLLLTKRNKNDHQWLWLL